MRLLEDWSNICFSSVRVISSMSEVVGRVPVNSKIESCERDLIDMNGSLESNGLNSLHWNTVWEVGKMFSVNRDMIISLVNMDFEVELVMVLKWVVVTDFWSPGSIDGGIHSNNVVMLKTEVHVKNDVWS